MSTPKLVAACVPTAKFPFGQHHSLLPAISHIEYTRMSSPICLYMNNQVVTLSVRRGPDVLMNVSMREQRALSNYILQCGKVYYSNIIIVKILM
jgi:hypothetical protein